MAVIRYITILQAMVLSRNCHVHRCETCALARPCAVKRVVMYSMPSSIRQQFVRHGDDMASQPRHVTSGSVVCSRVCKQSSEILSLVWEHIEERRTHASDEASRLR